MMKLACDLHIHSCLSPCADEDMTPASICGMAHLKGLDAIAVTDHNSARNLPYVKEAADYYGLILLPGLEITTREEVHMLGYFPTVEQAVEAGEFFSSHLPPIKNKPELFGTQFVMNTDDEVQAVEERMLIGATDLPLEECAAYVINNGGLAVPAHINRGSSGLLINLGFMPFEPEFPVVETARHLPLDERAVKGRMQLHSSDAHQLGNILEREFFLETDGKILDDILKALKKTS